MNKEKKKTLLLAVTKSSWGGAQKYVYDLAQGFQSEYDVHILCGANEFGGENLFVSKLELLGVRVHQIGTLKRDVSLFDEIRSARSIYRVFKQVDPDIVHLNSSKMGALGGAIARLCRIKQITYTVHGFPQFEDRPRWQKIIIDIITRLTFLFAHQIILISQKEYKYAQSKYSKKKSVLIYNGIHNFKIEAQEQSRTWLLKDAPEAIQEKLQSSAIVLGNVAELVKNKGISYTLEAIRVLKEQGYNIVYIHIGIGGLRDLLESEVKEKKLEDDVYFAGFRDAKPLLNAFDILVFPSIKEGLPYVPIEAGYTGLAVVATRVGGIPEIIEDEHSGILIEPKNSQQIVNAVKYLVDNSDIRRLYAHNLHTKVISTFTLSRMLEKTREVYES
ncbi:MAG: glycosyltransferase [Patescibacteria group bacterium]